MPPKAVAVVPPSPSKRCWKCTSNTELPFCAHCGAIQDCPPLTHFEVMGLKPELRIHEDQLREKFYALSKLLHPDRFVSKASPEPQHALRWSTALNRAFQTLRDRESRSEYLLTLHGLTAGKEKASIPLDLAEAYFELQESLGSPEAGNQISAFRAELDRQIAAQSQQWELIADRFHAGESTAALKALREHLITSNYLQSMKEDFEKKVGQ